MPGPLSGMKFIHQAFRLDLQRSQAEIKFWATLADGDPQAIHDRFAMLHESLALHEMAEEEVLFPAVNAIEAGRADTFIQAHRQIDPLRNSILEALKAQNADRAFDGIMELVALMKEHLDQEESDLLPWCDEKISFPDQGKLAGEMGQKIPQEMFGKMVPWMIRLLNVDDREGVMRMWSTVMAAPAFDMIKSLVKGTLKDNEWADLTGRYPEIA